VDLILSIYFLILICAGICHLHVKITLIYILKVAVLMQYLVGMSALGIMYLAKSATYSG